MKTATVRQIRNQFPAVLRLIENGESVAITSHRKVVANLVPPIKPPAPKRAWADIDERLQRLLSHPMPKISAAQMLNEDRDRY
jgi:antitoxin (DNA-binding transcriptional repressor) of toxin-antitoxin stability system